MNLISVILPAIAIATAVGLSTLRGTVTNRLPRRSATVYDSVDVRGLNGPVV